MRINHNIAALNTYRQLTGNTNSTSKSLEKLSSGLRINRAGDDAAGLAISEKMRSQIRGLDMASKNAADGISLISTAEGALNETHSILQRMKELAVQASNDTNTAEDRAEIQKEIDQLAEEVTRIADQTEFNTKKLLDGTMASKADKTADAGNAAGADAKIIVAAGTPPKEGTYTIKVTAIPGSEAPSSGASVDASAYSGADAVYTYNEANSRWEDAGGDEVILSTVGLTVTGTPADGDKIDATAEVTGKVDITGTTGTLSGVVVDGTSSEPAGTYTLDFDGSDWTIGGDTAIPSNYGLDASGVTGTGSITIDVSDVPASATYQAAGGTGDASAAKYEYSVAGVDGNGDAIGGVKASAFEIDFNAATVVGDTYTVEVSNKNASIFHIGANQGQNTSLSINKMDAESLGINNLVLTEQDTADAAITTIDNAISKVSSQRAALGAMQNRLEHTINNLGTASENLTAAESRIRDVDMAQEMMEFTKNNILSQASQAMLAQANMQPQSVLQLLQ